MKKYIIVILLVAFPQITFGAVQSFQNNGSTYYFNDTATFQRFSYQSHGVQSDNTLILDIVRPEGEVGSCDDIDFNIYGLEDVYTTGVVKLYRTIQNSCTRQTVATTTGYVIEKREYPMNGSISTDGAPVYLRESLQQLIPNNLYDVVIGTGGSSKLVYGPNYTLPISYVPSGADDSGLAPTYDPLFFYGEEQPIVPTNSGPATTTPPCTTNCYSSVMFFPGIMGSKLYEESSFENSPVELQRWSSIKDFDQSRLEMDPNGYSINNLYTKASTSTNEGVIDEILGQNIYKSFMDDLGQMKASSTIADYSLIPYDWRLPLSEIVQKGKVEGDKLYYGAPVSNLSDSFIVKELQRLADNSKSGKVTIVAHSNGGLVTKELIQTLKETNNPLYNKIDKVIMVAVPQAGTPDALLNLLHGSDVGPSFLPYVSAERGRDLSRNMPMTYNLLPNESLVNNVNPIIEFEQGSVPSNIYGAYGPAISSYGELQAYLRGDEGRLQPGFSDLNNPARANALLITKGQQTHQRIDNFESATTTQIVQIAGWGLYTPTGIKYGLTQKCKSKILNICTEYQLERTINEKLTLNGDKTVVAGSALAIDSSSSTSKYWINLEKYNQEYIDRKHSSIMEVVNLRNFIKSQLLGYSTQEKYISTSEPVSSSIYTKYSLHSPLNMSITDSQGNIISSSTNDVTNAYYYQLGDTKTIIVPSATPHTLKLDAYANGSFSLDIEKLQGDTIISSSSFQAIPTSTSTKATLDSNSTNTSTSTLKLDFDGNGTQDATLTTNEGKVTIYDTTPPELKLTFSTSTKDVILSATDNIDSNPTLTVGTSTMTLKDNQNNTTVINFTKLRDTSTKLVLKYNSVTRNGVSTTTPNTRIEYDWKLDNQGNLKDLGTKIFMKGIEKTTLNYNKNNTTTIKMKDIIIGNITTTTQTGFVPVTITTRNNADLLDISY